MKFFSSKPTDFLEALLEWEKVPRLRKKRILDEEEDPPPGRSARILRDLRFLRELDLLSPAAGGGPGRYVEAVYTTGEMDRILGNSGNRWCSREEFLDEVRSFRHYRRFFQQERKNTAGKLLAFLMTAPKPLFLGETVRALRLRRREEFARALFEGMRRAVIVLFLNEAALSPAAGVWPHVPGTDSEDWKQSLRLTPVSLVERDLEVVPPVFLREMESVLLHAAFSGLRLRENRRDIYQKDFRKITRDWPEYFPASLHKHILPPGERMRGVLSFLQGRAFLERKEGGGAGGYLKITDEGLKLLRLPLAQRVSRIAGEIKAGILSLPSGAAALAVLTDLLKTGDSFALDDLIEFALETAGSGTGPGREALEKALFAYLLPLGGLKIGVGERGRVLLGLSGTGYYLLDLSGMPPWEEAPVRRIYLHSDGRIMLGEGGPGIEDKLVRLCERTPPDSESAWAYRLTEKSIASAAAEGLPLEVILFVLETLSGETLPAELRAMISRRYAAVHRASLVSGLLYECDKETAKKIAGFDRHVRRIGNRFVLIEPEALTKDFFALCRREGILLTDPRSPGSRNSPGPFPPV